MPNEKELFVCDTTEQHRLSMMETTKRSKENKVVFKYEEGCFNPKDAS